MASTKEDMDAKSKSEAYNHPRPTSTSTDAPQGTTTFTDEASPPIYFDSEPSSQPPKYPSSSPSSKPTHQHAPASAISAILAYPNEDFDAQRRAERKKKTFRERWRGFKERNFVSEYDNMESGGSAAEWNVIGARVGGGVTSPYRKKER